jgi:hypothetical protein
MYLRLEQIARVLVPCAALLRLVDGATAQSTDPVSLLLAHIDESVALIARAEGERMQAILPLESNSHTIAARALLRSAIRQLSNTSEEIGQLIAGAPRLRQGKTSRRGELYRNTIELQRLQVAAGYHLGRAYRLQALCYSPQSPDRENALQLARQRLEPLVTRQDSDALTWPSRIELLAVLRGQGELELAAQHLEPWLHQVPPDAADALADERARLALAAGRLEDAIAVYGGGSPAVARAAREAYFTGQIEHALKLYDRTVSEFFKQNLGERAFEHALTAAAIVHSIGDEPESLQRLLMLARRMPEHPQAAQVHRQAIVIVAGLVKRAGKAEQPVLLNNYQELLAEHVSRWPKSSTANDARWWLAGLLKARHEYHDAAAQLQSITPESPRWREARAEHVELLTRMGEVDEARKLQRLTDPSSNTPP